MNWADLLIGILEFSRIHGMWSLPTNPISALIYFAFACYGYTKLKKHFSPRPLAFIYAICILGSINFMMEHVWLTAFFVRFHFFNNGWLINPYLTLSGWVLNYYRNFVVMLVLYYISRESWKHVKFYKRTILGMVGLSLFLFFIFFVTNSYAQIDWGYGLYWGYSKELIVNGFLLTLIGKPMLFYIYRSVWKDRK